MVFNRWFKDALNPNSPPKPNNWEIFIEIAPTVNVVAVGNSGFYVFGAHIGKGGGFWLPGLLGFGGEFGFRYWF